MLESLREAEFTDAVERAENVNKAINYLKMATELLTKLESVTITAAAFMDTPEDDRIMSLAFDLERLEDGYKKQIERMEKL